MTIETAPAHLAPAAPPRAVAPAPLNFTHKVVIVQRDSGPNLLVRAIWFLFIGSWLSAAAIFVAYFACLTIVGLPLGFMIFNRLPAIMTLRPRTDVQSVEVRDGVTYITGGTVEQYPMWARALWFLAIGWWGRRDLPRDRVVPERPHHHDADRAVHVQPGRRGDDPASSLSQPFTPRTRCRDVVGRPGTCALASSRLSPQPRRSARRAPAAARRAPAAR